MGNIDVAREKLKILRGIEIESNISDELFVTRKQLYNNNNNKPLVLGDYCNKVKALCIVNFVKDNIFAVKLDDRVGFDNLGNRVEIRENVVCDISNMSDKNAWHFLAVLHISNLKYIWDDDKVRFSNLVYTALMCTDRLKFVRKDRGTYILSCINSDNIDKNFIRSIAIDDFVEVCHRISSYNLKKLGLNVRAAYALMISTGDETPYYTLVEDLIENVRIDYASILADVVLFVGYIRHLGVHTKQEHEAIGVAFRSFVRQNMYT